MLIGDAIVVVTDRRIASRIAHRLDRLDPVRIQSIFIVDNRVEADDIPFLQRRRITFFDKNQIARSKRRYHGIRLYRQRRIAKYICNVLIVPRRHRRERIQRRDQNDRPQNHTEHNCTCPFQNFHNRFSFSRTRYSLCAL